jgi:hypothetical protein
MRIYVVIIILLFSFLPYCPAQNIHLVGTLTFNNIRSNYILQFTRKQQSIVGYSYANIGTSDETKCSISGTIDTNNQLLNIKETAIIYSKSALPYNQFCMLELHLKKTIKKNLSIFKGTCKGVLFNSNTFCASGTIMMIKQEEATKKINELLPSIDSLHVKTMMKGIVDFNETDKLSVTTIFPYEENEFTCTSNKVILTIQDNNEVDHDKIAIRVNNELVLDQYELTKTPKQLTIPINSSLTTIKISALNEGNNSPNTAQIILQSASVSKSYISNLNIGTSTTIHIKKD